MDKKLLPILSVVTGKFLTQHVKEFDSIHIIFLKKNVLSADMPDIVLDAGNMKMNKMYNPCPQWFHSLMELGRHVYR